MSDYDPTENKFKEDFQVREQDMNLPKPENPTNAKDVLLEPPYSCTTFLGDQIEVLRHWLAQKACAMASFEKTFNNSFRLVQDLKAIMSQQHGGTTEQILMEDWTRRWHSYTFFYHTGMIAELSSKLAYCND